MRYPYTMKCIIGKKLEMTRVFKDDGTVVPVTLVQAGPCKVVALKTGEKDGYFAVQLGFGSRKKKNVSKAQLGAWKDLGVFEFVRECRMNDLKGFEVGGDVNASLFEVGDKVEVVGTSKGRGFQGVVRRHGFAGHCTSHGTKDAVRMPGSIGQAGVQRVFKGMRMPGHMGDASVTVKNLEIVEVQKDKNIIAVKGAIPGGRNSVVIIKAVA
jgi:large subunit ribosomal protein L3